MKASIAGFINEFLKLSPLLTALAACAVSPQPYSLEEFEAIGATDRLAMFSEVEPITRDITLAEAIARTLKYNLDARTKVMENAVAYGQLSLDSFEGLPRVVTESGYAGRSNHGAINSRDSVTLEDSLTNPSYSVDRDRMVASAGLSWNVLDFGVSWFTARQNADRYLIVDERRRKAVFTLVQEVQVAYWRAYAHQLMSERISTVVADARVALANAQQIEVEQIQSPLETLRYQKSLLENLRQLWQIEQELVSARAELASLMTLPPGSNFRLAPVEKEKIGPLPDDFSIEQLEQIAFQNNPDIREQTYQSRISAQEARKAILKMLPGISFNVSRQYDSNSFLVDNQWYESSAKLSWNLLSLLSVPAQIEFAESGIKLANARRMALRMAILAQTHVGVRQFATARNQFEIANEIALVDRSIADAVGIRSMNDAQSMTEATAYRTSAVLSEYRAIQAYAQVQAARARVFATIGLSLIDRGVEDVSVSSLAEKIDTELRKWATWEFARPATEVDKEPGLSAIFAKTDALPAREILIYSRDQISTIYQNREYGLGRTNVNRGYNPRLQTEVDGPIIVDWGVLDTLGGSIEPNRGYGPRVQTEARGAITVDWSVLNTLGDLPPISSDIRPPAPPLLENRVR